MTKIKLSVQRGCASFALIAMGVGLTMIASAAALAPLYENDFSTRTTYDLPPGAAWTTSHTRIFGGPTWSYAPWQANAPGAVLVDTNPVGHDKDGVLLIVR